MKRKNVLPTDLATLVSGLVAEVTPTPEPKKTTKKTGRKRTPMARVIIAGAIAVIGATADSAMAYLNGFMALPPRSKAGYDNFWSNDDGFTNRQKFLNISVQGVAKMSTVLRYQAARIIARGGDNATAMEAALEGLDSAWDTILEKALADQKQADFENAFNALVAGLPDAKFPTAEAKYQHAVEKLTAHAEEHGVTIPSLPEAEAEAEAEVETVEPTDPAATTVIEDNEVEGDEPETEGADLEEVTA